MAAILPGNTFTLRARHDAALRRAAHGVIILGESLFVAAHTIGTMALIGRRHTGHDAAHRGKLLVAAAFGLLVWLLSFLAIGGQWLTMWQSAGWTGPQAALRFYVTLLAAGIVIALKGRLRVG